MLETVSEDGEQAAPTRTQDDVVGVLSERVEVDAVDARPQDGLTFVTIRIPEGITEQARLATEEWVQAQLQALSDEVVFVPRYV